LPDLIPLDFFLWGYVKEKVFAQQPTTLKDMKARIIDVFRSITPEMLAFVRDSLENGKKVNKC
jgi:hypothetical protein